MKIHCSKGYATNLLFRQQNSIRLPNENSRLTFLVFTTVTYCNLSSSVVVGRMVFVVCRALTILHFYFLKIKKSMVINFGVKI